MTVIALRHSISDGIGSLEIPIKKAGLECRYVDTYAEDLSEFNALEPELLIVMGGAPGVYQTDLYPFLADEIKIIAERVEHEKPVLGICLGAQMIAAAMGSDVYQGQNGFERGWHTITASEEGRKGPVRHLDAEHGPVLQWHRDTFDLPQRATLLASSEQYKNQIFSVGENIMGVQCHIEITPRILNSWYVNAAHAAAEGTIDLGHLRAETAQHGAKKMQQSEKFMTDWLKDIGVSRAGD